MALTNEEAIKILSVNGWGFTDGELKEATQMATRALKEKSEAQEYRTPKKPEEITRGYYACPICGGVLQYCQSVHCPDCGQALDWAEVE